MLNPHSPNVYISTNFAKNNAIQTANSRLYEHLPKTLPCRVCRKQKPVQAYSKTQLLKAAPSLYTSRGTNFREQVTCKDCTPQQTDKLTCCVCTKTMPLKAFAKAQRKHVEKARCLSCVKRFVEEEDDSYESSTDSGDESDCSVSGENESDGESANPYADDFGDDARSTITHATARTTVTTRTERSVASATTTKSKKSKDDKIYTTWNDILPLGK